MCRRYAERLSVLCDHVQMQAHYHTQCEVTVDALRTHFRSSEISFVAPRCGMFVWVDFLDTDLSSFELFQHFAAAGVITVPAADFHVAGLHRSQDAVDKKISSVRLTFAAAQPAQIREAVQKMAECYRRSKFNES